MKLIKIGVLALICAKYAQSEIIEGDDSTVAQDINFSVGSFQSQDLKEAQPVLNYLNDVLLDIDRLSLVIYKRQVVNGTNHRLTFKYPNGQLQTFTIYESLQGEFTLIDTN